MQDKGKAYWYAVLRLVGIILAVWFVAGYVFGILLAPVLNNIHVGGYPLGFWFAHQGSMYIFVALIFIYAKLQGQLDRKFDVHEE